MKEVEIVNILYHNFEKIDKFKEGNWIKMKEKGFHYGIADIVCFDVDKEGTEARIKNSLTEPILNRQAILVYNILPEEKPLSFDYLVSLLKINSQNSINLLKYKTLKFLKDFNYIKEIKKDVYIKTPGFYYTSKNTIAIEVKISNWSQGLKQAIRYKDFADESYLAIYEEYVHRALNNKIELLNNNIGLISISQNNARVIFEPKKKNKTNFVNTGLANETAFKEYLIMV